MESLLTTFRENVLNIDKPNLCLLEELINNIKIVEYSSLDMKKIAVIFVYCEVKMIISLMEFIQKNEEKYVDKSEIFFIQNKVEFIITQLNVLISFLMKEQPGSSAVNTLKYYLISIKKSSMRKGIWLKYAEKMDVAIETLAKESLFNNTIYNVINNCASKEVIPSSLILPHLKQIAQPNALSLDNHLMAVNISSIFCRARELHSSRSRANEFKQTVNQWKKCWASLGVITKNNTFFRLSTSTQTMNSECNGNSEHDQCTSMPIKNPTSTRNLVPLEAQVDLLEHLSTPPDSPWLPKQTNAICVPTHSTPLCSRNKPRIPQPIRLIMKGNDDTNKTSVTDLSLTDTETRSRQRIPWSMSESLALWHGTETTNPVSWSKIWRQSFAKSQRTPIDLKDRWRVITRNQNLQAEIRKYYSQWLLSKGVHSN